MPHDELTERLEAFAAATLDPDPGSMARIRSELVVRASRPPVPAERYPVPALLAPLALGLQTLRRTFAGSPARFRTFQRLAYVAGALAIAVSMASGASAAARPGAPLYGARIWLEAVTLPAGGPARAARELPLLEARLNEIREAAASGDQKALDAAVGAYEQTVDDAVRNAGADRANLDETLSKHVAVLQGLLGTTGGKSGSAISAAIERAITRIEAGQGDGGNQGGNGDGTGDGTQGDDQGNGNGNGNGDQGGNGNGNGGQGAGQSHQPPTHPTPRATSHPTPRAPDHPTPKPHDH